MKDSDPYVCDGGHLPATTQAEIQTAIDEAQKDVSGTARVKLYKGSCTLAGRKSKNSLYRLDIATFEEDDVYNQKDAEGFIKLNALRLRVLLTGAVGALSTGLLVLVTRGGVATTFGLALATATFLLHAQAERDRFMRGERP